MRGHWGKREASKERRGGPGQGVRRGDLTEHCRGACEREAYVGLLWRGRSCVGAPPPHAGLQSPPSELLEAYGRSVACIPSERETLERSKKEDLTYWLLKITLSQGKPEKLKSQEEFKET